MSALRLFCCVCLCTLVPVAAGCAMIEPPAGYVAVKEHSGYDFKAVSSVGNVIALTARPNEDRSADLKFWSEAVIHQKVGIDGMKLAAKDAIKSKSGLDGALFNFESGEGQAKISYLVALYVTPVRIYTIEATGPAKALAEDMDKLKASMQSLR